MKITTTSDTLRVSDLYDLHELQVDDLARSIRTALTPAHAVIEFDLAQLRSSDCGSIDVLLGIREELNQPGSLTWRVVNPPPDFRQLLELVRLHHLFEITPPRVPHLVYL